MQDFGDRDRVELPALVFQLNIPVSFRGDQFGREAVMSSHEIISAPASMSALANIVPAFSATSRKGGSLSGALKVALRRGTESRSDPVMVKGPIIPGHDGHFTTHFFL